MNSINYAKRYEHQLAVIYIDLDNFKKINDEFGHEEGDEVLMKVATMLRSMTRESDTAARIGGDEFILLMENIGSEKDPILLVERILSNLDREWVTGRREISLTASIGISLYPQNGSDPTELIKAADNAMYVAKKKRNTYQLSGVIN
jgi:diguanylate cyclase (GGDEF)-like protein